VYVCVSQINSKGCGHALATFSAGHGRMYKLLALVMFQIQKTEFFLDFCPLAGYLKFFYIDNSVKFKDTTLLGQGRH